VVLLLLVVLLAVSVLFLMSRSASRDPHARFNILVYYVQTALLLLRAKSDTEVARVFAFLHVFALNAAEPTGRHCVAQLSTQQRMLFDALLPLAAFGLLIALVLGRTLWRWLQLLCLAHAGSPRFHRQSQMSLSHDHAATVPAPMLWSSQADSQTFVRASVTLGLTAYQQIVVSLMLVLQCVDVGPYRVLFSAPSIHCTSGYRALQPLFLTLLLVLTVGIPTLLGWMAFRHRTSAQRMVPKPSTLVAAAHGDAVAGSVAAASALQVTALSACYDALFALFRPSYSAWLVVILLRRVSLIAVSVLLVSSPPLQSLLFSILCLLILLSHLHAQPYRLPADNQLESIALLALLLLAQLLSYQDSVDNPALPIGVQVAVGVLLTPPLLILTAAAAQALWHHPRVQVWRRYCSSGSNAPALRREGTSLSILSCSSTGDVKPAGDSWRQPLLDD
jgi:hypothetical protein